MRVLLDTHIFIWYAKEQNKLSRNVLAVLSDYENERYSISIKSIMRHIPNLKSMKFRITMILPTT
jgi:PIN domain nuclease of toxin-antitoxin system